MAVQFPKFLYESRLKDATPVASSTATGDFNVLNLRDFRPYTFWKPASLPATVTVDSGVARAVDYWGLWGHDLFTRGGTVELRSSTDNFAANDVLVDTLAPASDKPFMRAVASTSVRYWRLRFLNGTAPSVAIALLGVALVSQVGLRYGFDPLKRQVHGGYNRSVKGYPLGKVIEWREWSHEVELRFVTQTWLRSTFDPAWEAHLEHSPFVFQWDPGDHASELYLVQAGDKRDSDHESNNFAHLSIALSGVAQ